MVSKMKSGKRKAYMNEFDREVERFTSSSVKKKKKTTVNDLVVPTLMVLDEKIAEPIEEGLFTKELRDEIDHFLKHQEEQKTAQLNYLENMPKRRRTKSRRRRKKSRKVNYQYLANKVLRAAEITDGQKRPIGSDASKQFYGNSWKQVLQDISYGDPQTKAKAMQQFNNRRKMKYYGSGDYYDTLKTYGKGALRLGSAIGTAGSVAYQGGNLSQIGRAWERGVKRGSAVAKMYGFGDYSTNQIVGAPPENPQQSIHHVTTAPNDLSGDIIYSNTEFVQNVYATIVSGASAFNLESFPLNPALSSTFPFLSQIAQNFELYEFVGLLFHYKPTSGEFGSNNSNALGKVILATNYDPDATEFPNSIVMENYDWACSTKPSDGCVHGVECVPSQRATNQLYTRTGAGNKDKVFTDLGLFQIATEGIPSSVAQDVLIGELWVTYTVKLSRAKLYQSLGEAIPYLAIKGSMGVDLALKTWTPDEASTISYKVGADVNGVQIGTVPVNADTLQFAFGDGFAGKRMLISTYSNNTLAPSNSVSFSSPVGISIDNQGSAYQGTSQRFSMCVIDFDAIGTEYTIFMDYGSAPSATQNDRISFTIVDPDYEYAF